MFTLASLPNWMTVMRIAITPLVAVLIWSDMAPHGYQFALYLYTIASVTDYVDGFIARRLKVESRFGEMLDPIADKLLIAAVLLALASVDKSGWLFLVPALDFELLPNQFDVETLQNASHSLLHGYYRFHR